MLFISWDFLFFCKIGRDLFIIMNRADHNTVSYYILNWLVELVLQDLLDWNNWFFRARVLPTMALPSGKMGQGIGLGSNAVVGYHDYSPDAIRAPSTLST